MYCITSDEIRNIFLDYFKKNNHMQISGSSIIPKNDPTLLFINSGMAPLKTYFTGEEIPPEKNLCNIQPCIRTIDIDEIGDRHHLTSFEMLGSWSFDNYFKEDAIKLAFRLLTEGYKIPKEKLYATVFAGSEKLGLSMDQESADIWKEAGMDPAHIVPQPFEDNFWGPTAETGPCGPCTEVFYDTGEEFGEAYVPGGHFDTKKRYIEIWNAGVFMQFNKNTKGEYENLKFKSVDTGAGLERLTMTLNKLNSVYEIDSLKPIVDLIQEEMKGTEVAERDVHVMTDHFRTSTILLAAGVQPSNTGRGYIPRRLIRKCCTIIHKYQVENFNYEKIVDKVIKHYAKYYDHFEANRANILKMLQQEISSYNEILKEGIQRIEKICEKSGDIVSGNDAFVLVTTYGLPYALVEEYVNKCGKKVDKEGYKKAENHHKEISRNESAHDKDDSQISNQELKDLESSLEEIVETDFSGYEKLSCEAKVLFISQNGEKKDTLAEGEKAAVVFNTSCFYAESGGQVADTGEISNQSMTGKVLDVKKVKGKFVHFVQVEQGVLKCGDQLQLNVNGERRTKIEANHSAVHLLQYALREVCGKDVKQAGSLVTDERLRFDFYCDEKLQDELDVVEKLVNKTIQQNLSKDIKLTTYEDAIREGALAFFENKYGNEVRLVSFGEISRELCGGTHIESTGKIGLFKILSEESVGRGIRRITAVTGECALDYVQSELKILREVSKKLKVSTNQILAKLNSFDGKKQVAAENKKIQLTKEEVSKLIKQSSGNIKYVFYQEDEFVENLNNEAIRIANDIQGVTCLLAVADQSVKIAVAVPKAMTKEINAGNILKKAVTYIDGKGGGAPHLAMGGGSNVDGIKKLEEDFGSLF
ncbi:alanine--tRNA ligase [Anaeromicropila populeti]|uniref:Alanine--tRNA ligase n=1 Tax=Anaeromicropila populeti TaxID=37658 RepID=A0A1I6LLH5_9FIRM|nr:alanine--tRNA ligase [Anaeromicropila populeti]SFS04417.1 alanyl-tRNA synthetase [Anaeromicropila populeti]